MHKTTDAVEILYAHIGDDPEMLEMIRLARIAERLADWPTVFAIKLN